jgi:hypothetical protein
MRPLKNRKSHYVSCVLFPMSRGTGLGQRPNRGILTLEEIIRVLRQEGKGVLSALHVANFEENSRGEECSVKVRLADIIVLFNVVLTLLSSRSLLAYFLEHENMRICSKKITWSDRPRGLSIQHGALSQTLPVCCLLEFLANLAV